MVQIKIDEVFSFGHYTGSTRTRGREEGDGGKRGWREVYKLPVYFHLAF